MKTAIEKTKCLTAVGLALVFLQHYDMTLQPDHPA